MKDFDEFIASQGLTPVAGEPHAYTDSSGKTIVGTRRSGDYLLVASDLDLLAHTGDPRSLLRSVLGKQDVAVQGGAIGVPGSNGCSPNPEWVNVFFEDGCVRPWFCRCN